MAKISSLLVAFFLLAMGSEVWSMNLAKQKMPRKIFSAHRATYADYTPVVIKLENAKKAFTDDNHNKLTMLTFATLNETQNTKYGPDLIYFIKENQGLPNARDEYGRTAWHWAAINDWPLINFLAFDSKLNPNEEDDFGYTPLMYAIEKENLIAAAYTLCHPDVILTSYSTEGTQENSLVLNSSLEMRELILEGQKLKTIRHQMNNKTKQMIWRANELAKEKQNNNE